MNDKNENSGENREDDDVGFRFTLPGLGWMRGDGSHLSALMPTIRWILILSWLSFMAFRLIEELQQ